MPHVVDGHGGLARKSLLGTSTDSSRGAQGSGGSPCSERALAWMAAKRLLASANTSSADFPPRDFASSRISATASGARSSASFTMSRIDAAAFEVISVFPLNFPVIFPTRDRFEGPSELRRDAGGGSVG